MTTRKALVTRDEGGGGGGVRAGPTIREGSVTFAQDAESKRVTIGYELEGAPAIVTVDILTNGVSIGSEHLTHMAGDVNRRVEAGAPRHADERLLHRRLLRHAEAVFQPEGHVAELLHGAPRDASAREHEL